MSKPSTTKPAEVNEVLETMVPVITTEEEFREVDGHFKRGGHVLAMGFLPEQKQVLGIMLGLFTGMMESPFSLDEDGNVFRKPNAEPAPAPVPLDLTLVPDPHAPPAPAEYPQGDFEPVLTGGRYA